MTILLDGSRRGPALIILMVRCVVEGRAVLRMTEVTEACRMRDHLRVGGAPKKRSKRVRLSCPAREDETLLSASYGRPDDGPGHPVALPPSALRNSLPSSKAITEVDRSLLTNVRPRLGCPYHGAHARVASLRLELERATATGRSGSMRSG